jgi:hypothetical protein
MPRIRDSDVVTITLHMRFSQKKCLATTAKAPHGGCQHFGTVPAIFGEIHRTAISYEVQFGRGIQELTDSGGLFHAHFIKRAHTGEESCSVRRTTCCNFIQRIGGVERRHSVPAALLISAKAASGEPFNLAPAHFARQSIVS